MINSLVVVRTFLQSRSMLSGVNLIAGPRLPIGYSIRADDEKPTTLSGQSILFNVRGGLLDASAVIIRPSFQFLSYAEDEESANNLGLALWDALFDQQTSLITATEPEGMPRLLFDDDANAPFSLQFWTIDIRNT